MSDKKGRSRMIIPTAILAAVAVVLLIMGYQKGGGQHVQGLRTALFMILEILPLLVAAFIIAGMVQVLLPQQEIARWVGEESGLKGLLMGAFAGGLTPGGPWVSMPLAAGFYRAGAGIGTVVAFITGWALWSFSRIPVEIGILGWKLTGIRLACTVIFPPIAGYIATLLFSGVK